MKVLTQDGNWVEAKPRELTIGNVYHIPEHSSEFMPGMFLSFGHWLKDSKSVNPSRFLIADEKIPLPVYPSMPIETAAVLFLQLYSKGMYLFPEELIKCFAKDGIDYEEAAKWSYYFRDKEHHKEDRFADFTVLMIRLYEEQNNLHKLSWEINE